MTGAAVVAVDVGTGSAHAGVFGPDGRVLGLSFDATCSPVALDREGRPASVSTTGEDRWNVVVWLDHRAIAEAERCTASAHRVPERWPARARAGSGGDRRHPATLAERRRCLSDGQ